MRAGARGLDLGTAVMPVVALVASLATRVASRTCHRDLGCYVARVVGLLRPTMVLAYMYGIPYCIYGIDELIQKSSNFLGHNGFSCSFTVSRPIQKRIRLINPRLLMYGSADRK